MAGLSEEHSLYDQLGAEPSADEEQLRQAYRRRARELHPDLNAGLDAGPAMQQLNAAWAVLGDPHSRRRYDEENQDRDGLPPAGQAPPPPPPVFHDEPIPLSSAMGCLGMVFRPSVVIPAVLFIIFVFTAYAGHGGTTGTGEPATTVTTGVGATSTVPAAALVGRCIRNQPESVQVVPCSELPNSLVIAAMPAGALCPTGTTGYQLSGMTEMVCASPNGP